MANKTYKVLLRNKKTKKYLIVYANNTTKPAVKLQLVDKYPDYTFADISLDKGTTLVYYCNTCDKEVPIREKTTHTCN